MLKMLLFRCIVGTSGYTIMVLAIMRIPIATFSILNNTAPFWAAILGYFIAGDQILKFEIFCMIGCFCGVLILTLEKDTEILEKRQTSLIGIWMAIICAVGYAFVTVAARQLRAVSAPLMIFYYSSFASTAFAIYLFLIARSYTIFSYTKS